MKKTLRHNPLRNESGFMIADFIFSFTMVIGIGIFIFALTFSLATIEVAQYIVWSTARNFAAANTTEDVARTQATEKFDNLTKQFPLLTGNGDAESPWFRLTSADLKIGDLAKPAVDPDFSSSLSAEDRLNMNRQPWTGASAKLTLVLFSNLKVPFLGNVAQNKDLFTFPVRAFVIRHPSEEECQRFFYQQRYDNGIKRLENSQLADPMATTGLTGNGGAGSVNNGFGEDNGC